MTVLRAVVLVSIWSLAISPSQVASAAKISPQQLEFDTHLDEPILCVIFVDLDGRSVTGIDVVATGLLIDYRIQNLGSGHFRVDVAPETLEAGSIHGKIQVLADGQPIGDPVTILGQVKPWIASRPSKLFLGSIGHGKQFLAPKSWKLSLVSDTAAFNIESVGFPEIEGATWRCEPAAGVASREKTLVVEFSPDALAKGFPFGALARKFINIYTSHPEAAVLSIPVTGMLSVNTTGRDYSTYLYKGQLRWQGPWGTPNIAAAFLATLLLVTCGFGAALHRTVGAMVRTKHSSSVKRKALTIFQWLASCGIIGAMAFGCFFLVNTYSRGGWLGLAGGVLVLLFGIRNPRFFPIALAVLFGIALALHPAGIDRAASTGAVAEDKSISNRLLVWQGALQMMAEHPLSGVGTGKFGEVFMRDYQLPTHTQTYSTAINDFLTVGTERGLFAVGGATALAVWLVVAGFRVGRRHGNAVLTACSASVFCGLILCSFSSVAFESNLIWLLLTSAAVILAMLVWYALRESQTNALPKPGLLQTIGRLGRASLRSSAYALTTIMLLVAISCGTWWLASQIALSSRPAVLPISTVGVAGLEVRPRWRSSKGTIFYLGGRGESPATLLKHTLRPLAARGWRVLCFDLPQTTSQAHQTATSILATLRADRLLAHPWFVVGHRQGGQLALALAAIERPDAVASYLIPQNSAFENLSPSLLRSAITIPALFCAQSADPLARRRPADQSTASKENNKSIVYPGLFNQENKAWQLWIDDIDGFYSAPSQ